MGKDSTVDCLNRSLLFRLVERCFQHSTSFSLFCLTATYPWDRNRLVPGACMSRVSIVGSLYIYARVPCGTFPSFFGLRES